MVVYFYFWFCIQTRFIPARAFGGFHGYQALIRLFLPDALRLEVGILCTFGVQICYQVHQVRARAGLAAWAGMLNGWLCGECSD